MTTLVVGASGATGRLLVAQLLKRGEAVRAIVREGSELPSAIANPENFSATQATLLDLSDAELAQQVEGCDAVACCLGHHMTLAGIFGPPRRLVTDAIRRLCDAIKTHDPKQPVKLVLMNTAGNSNRDLAEPVSFAERCVIRLLRLMVPPHADNEDAADHLRTAIGPGDGRIEWVVVRPDTLIDEDEPTEYRTHPSPIRSAIFNAGRTSRINVGHFMAELIANEELWSEWKGRMPVIYDSTTD